MAAAHAEISDAELRAAYARSQRPSWPASFEAAMADPFYSRLVLLNAKHPPRAHRGAPSAATPPAPAPEPARPAWRPPAASPAAFDRKRAAAGDRDDD